MLGTFGGALEARKVDASGGKLSADVTGEVETEDGVLVIRRIHVAMRLAGAEGVRHSVDRARLVYLPGEPGFYGDMPGAATLDLLGRLSRQRVDLAWRTHLLDRLELAASDLRRRIREYSTGMKRKLGIVQALQADPPLL